MTVVDTNAPTLTGQREILAAVTGLTYRRLDYWTRKGYLVGYDETGAPNPTHIDWLGLEQDGPGAGNPRRWDAAEIPTLRRVIALTASGMTPEAAFDIARIGNPVHLDGWTLTFVGDLA